MIPHLSPPPFQLSPTSSQSNLIKSIQNHNILQLSNYITSKKTSSNANDDEKDVGNEEEEIWIWINDFLIKSLLELERKTTSFNNDRILRKLVFEIMLNAMKNEYIDLGIIVNFIRLYGTSNQTILKNVTKTYISSSKIRSKFINDVKIFINVIENKLRMGCKKMGKSKTTLSQLLIYISLINETCSTLTPLVETFHNIISDEMTSSLIKTIIDSYHVILTPCSLEYVKLNNLDGVNAIKLVKKSCLELIHGCIKYSFLSNDYSEKLELFLEFISQCFIKNMEEDDDIGKKEFLVDCLFGIDFDVLYDFERMVMENIPREFEDFDVRLGYFLKIISNATKDAGLEDVKSHNEIKKKGNNVSEMELSILDNHVMALSTLADLFPDVSQVKLNLLLRLNDGNVEVCTMKVLEGDVPSDLELERELRKIRKDVDKRVDKKVDKRVDKRLDKKVDKKEEPPKYEESQVDHDFPLLSQRKGVHEMDGFDLMEASLRGDSGIRMIKRNMSENVFTDSSFVKEMKNSIIASVENMKFDEYEDEFDDAYDYDDVEGRRGKVIMNDVEDVFGDKVSLLMGYFTKNKGVFETGERRSKERIRLKEESGMSDEQLEGWYKMLNRDPSKLRRMIEEQEMRDLTKIGGGGGDESEEGESVGEKQSNSTNQKRLEQDRRYKDKRGNEARRRGADRKKGIL